MARTYKGEDWGWAVDWARGGDCMRIGIKIDLIVGNCEIAAANTASN